MHKVQKKISILPIVIYSLAALFLFYEMALQVSPSVMTRHLMRDFSINASKLGIMAAFYFYSYTLMQIPAGILFDYFGSRILISSAAFICALGGFFFSLTNTVVFASLGRFLMGIGSSFAFIGVLIVAARWFKPFYFAFLVGIAQLLAALGAMGGEIPLAASVNHFGWRNTIKFLSVIGVAIAIAAFIFIRDAPSKKKEKHHADELLSLGHKIKEIITHRQTWWIGVYAFSGWAPVVVFAALWGVPYLMDLYKVSNTMAAIACGMVWLGIGLTSPFLGYLSDKLRRRCLLIRICALIGLISSLIIIYAPNVPFPLACVLLLFFGIASSGQILSFALVKDINRPSMTATAIGLNNMAVVVGGAFLQPLVGWLLNLFWEGEMLNDVPVYSVSNYRFALSVVPLCYLLGLISSLFFIKETHCKAKYDSYADQL